MVCPAGSDVRGARHCRRVEVDGQQQWEVCHQKDPGAEATSLDRLADDGHQSQVQLPCLNTAMLFKALKNARSSVSPDQLATYAKFTQQFGKDG